MVRQLEEDVCQRRAERVRAGDECQGQLVGDDRVGQRRDAPGWVASEELGDGQAGGRAGGVAAVARDEAFDGRCTLLLA